jgi:hypothetical protein
MSDLCEMWSLPWHTLQRNLAKGIGTEKAGHAAPSLLGVNTQGAMLVANSWLSRARQQTVLPPTL